MNTKAYGLMDNIFSKLNVPFSFYEKAKSIPLKLIDQIPSNLLKNEHTLKMVYQDLEFDYKNPNH